jgi:hypothetical protein
MLLQEYTFFVVSVFESNSSFGTMHLNPIISLKRNMHILCLMLCPLYTLECKYFSMCYFVQLCFALAVNLLLCATPVLREVHIMLKKKARTIGKRPQQAVNHASHGPRATGSTLNAYYHNENIVQDRALLRSDQQPNCLVQGVEIMMGDIASLTGQNR